MSKDNITISRNYEKQNMLLMLKKAQIKYGYVPVEIMTEIATASNVCISEVYGITTFYSFLSRKPLGKNVIRICKSLPCYLKHSDTVVDSIADILGIKPGQTTPDKIFSFMLTNCIGACDQAPAMLVNNVIYGNLTPEKIRIILKEYT